MSGQRGPETVRGDTRERLYERGREAYRDVEKALAVSGFVQRIDALQALIDGRPHNQRAAVVAAMMIYLAGLPPRPPAPTPSPPPAPLAPGKALAVPQTEAA